MPKSIRLPKGSPFQKGQAPSGKDAPYYGQAPSRSEIYDKLEAQMATEMYTPKESYEIEEDLNEDLDERKIFMESMMEFLPIFKRFNQIKDPEAILQLAGPIAAKTLIHCMVFGDNRLRESAASKVLDRVMGKPVERQISLLGDINKMTEEEIDRDITRIIRQIPESEVAKLINTRSEDPVIESTPPEGTTARRNKD